MGTCLTVSTANVAMPAAPIALNEECPGAAD